METKECTTITNDQFDFEYHNTVYDDENMYSVRWADLSVTKYTKMR